ncbi:putative serine/threonine-protein kinase fhkC [Cladobotryum mycophilum]|uniref:Serine/threonine-protein kinase fhkC n=1 Tax=Cladobotryum mycophilum TaxID=491253 RepID=A0ABR0SG34_9HYPO
MSDPLSISASIIAVLQLAATATQYVKDVKNGSTDRLRLRDELRGITCLLEMLRDRIEDADDTTDTGLTLKPLFFNSLCGSDGPVNLFKTVLEDIIAKLAPQHKISRLMQPLTWPFDKKDIAEMLASLERLKSHFTLVMQNDTIELAKMLNVKLDDIGHKVQSSEAKARIDEAQAILRWISPLTFRQRHVAILEGVQPETGSWLLEHDTFQSWLKGIISILWCPGIPGAGKTNIVQVPPSLIIDHIERGNGPPNPVLTYVYCDYNQRSRQNTTDLLSSLLQQALQYSLNTSLPAEVSSLYELHKKYDTRPTLAQITDLLRKESGKYDVFYVVIDALDECSESEEDSLQFISAVCSLGPQVKLLCTSRSSTTFQSYFETSQKLEISASSEDIRKFLDSEIQQQFRLSKHVRADPTLKEHIIKAIIEECQGMFLLAKLHVDSLSQKITRKEVRSALRTLPATLDVTYSQALRRIYCQSQETIDLAESILFWVICARRPLTVLELQHMYAILPLPEAEALENDDLPDGDILTGACGGLIVVDSESQTVRPIHYTTQEYFERCHEQMLLDAKLKLTKICLKYLTLPNFSQGACASDFIMLQRLKQYPFLDYAAKYWGSDGGIFDTDSVLPDVHSFTSNTAAVEVANQAWSLHGFRNTDWSQEYPRNVPALVLVATFELPRILERMVLDGHDIEGKGTDGDTALIRAADLGRTENVRALLKLGAAVNARDHMDETALQKAAGNGDESIVKVLLDGSAEVNLKTSSDWTPLMSAVSSGNIEVVRLLVQAGAHLAAETVWGDSALSIATRNGQEGIALFLADHGAVLPRGPAGRRASIVASRKGFNQLVRRLTADYDAIAQKPLERQGSCIMEGLPEIQEEALQPVVDALKGETTIPNQTPHNDDSNVLDALEGVKYSVGFSKRYSLGTKLGKGHFAEVFRCFNKVTGVVYAVKLFKAIPEIQTYSLLNSVYNELRVMQELHQNGTYHPNMIRLVDLFAEYATSTIYLVMELATKGDLFNYIVQRQKLGEVDSRKVFSHIFSALEFLHDRGWAHRDIKPENIVIADDENLIVKLTDFGLMRKIDSGAGQGFTTTLCGTPSYVAPEILQDSKNRKYGLQVDIWSAGVVLYICLCGFPPFSDELYSKYFPYTLSQQIKSGRFDYPSPYWDPVSDSALDLIDLMLVVDPEKRLTVKKCMAHVWMRDTEASILHDIVRSESPEGLL